MKENVMKPEMSALICYYYQCKNYTPVRISNVTNRDIDTVKEVLRRNCPEFSIRERETKSKKEWCNTQRAMYTYC